jgi:hypothetical protein
MNKIFNKLKIHLFHFLIILFFTNLMNLCNCINNIRNSTRKKQNFNISSCINSKTRNMLNYIKSRGFYESDIVSKVMCLVDRKNFTNERHRVMDYEAYIDNNIYVGHGSTLTAPSIHAYVLEILYDKLKLKNRNDEIKILDIGSGTGYS